MHFARSLIVMSSLAACTAASEPTTVSPAAPQPQGPPPTAVCGSGAGSAVSGVVFGVVTDARSLDPLPGVTIVVTSPAMANAQTAITDDVGAYKIPLPDGTYMTTFYYLDYTLQHNDVPVRAGCETAVFQRIDTTSAARGERIHI